MDNRIPAKDKMKVNNSAELFHRPSFMKILVGGINYSSVQIPTDFMHHLEGVALDTATLTISSGQSWEVKVVKKENDIMLEDGWQKFRDDNDLSTGDVLLFTHSQNMSFDIKIYSPSGLERETGNLGEKGRFSDNDETDNDDSVKEIETSYGTNADWKDPNMAWRFIDFCLEAVPTGNRKTVRTMPWEDIRTRLKEEEHLDFTVKQLIYRWNDLKKRYKIWSELVAAAGNAYDPIKNKIKWSKKKWEQYLKEKPEARKFSRRPLEHPMKMKALFDN
ncbi:hypothetical protein M9H77_11347 [Catharanthus roseus]|uniref:Uncharacterized protein n=1 Tax=Catharanthus roseus TaxID=4058 RepID=A0ACC0BEE2_CATRO|nr:hypothetical protein M9H77_11347 [Catharanthus roseus]